MNPMLKDGLTLTNYDIFQEDERENVIVIQRNPSIASLEPTEATEKGERQAKENDSKEFEGREMDDVYRLGTKTDNADENTLEPRRVAKMDEVLPSLKYDRCADRKFAAYSIGVCLTCALFNLCFVVAGESGLMPEYDYLLFDKGYPVLWGTLCALIAHRTHTIRQYVDSGSLQRLTAVPLQKSQLRFNLQVLMFFDNVAGPIFGSLALFQGPVYFYLTLQRQHYDGVSLFYTVYLVSCVLQGYMMFNY